MGFAEDNVAKAKRLYDRGFCVIPAEYRGKKPRLRSWKEYQKRRPSWEETFPWFDIGEPLNVAILTGAVSGLVVVDADNTASVEWVLANLVSTPLSVKTAKGRHFYYRHPGEHVSNRAKLHGGVDLRGDGGYVIGPLSLHATGIVYEIEGDLAAELPRFDPSWLAEPRRQDTSRAYADAALKAELARVREAPDGTRNNALNQAAFSIGQLVAAGLISETLVESSLRATGLEAGLDERETDQTVRSGLTAGKKQPRWPSKGGRRGDPAMEGVSAIRLEEVLLDQERKPSFDVLCDLAREEFAWREGPRAYSRVRGRLLNTSEWADCYTPDALRVLLESAIELVEIAGCPSGKRDKAAIAMWKRWCRPAFVTCLELLPLRKDELTMEEEQGIGHLVKRILTREIRVSFGHDEIPIHTSILQQAMETDHESWIPVGHFPAFVKKGQIALRYEMFSGGIVVDSSVSRLSKRKLYELLRVHEIAESKTIRVGSKVLRAYVLAKEWLEATFEAGAHQPASEAQMLEPERVA